MEKEKDSIIMHLKDFIKNHNESILVGSIGSSLIGGRDGSNRTQTQIQNNGSE